MDVGEVEMARLNVSSLVCSWDLDSSSEDDNALSAFGTVLTRDLESSSEDEKWVSVFGTVLTPRVTSTFCQIANQRDKLGSAVQRVGRYVLLRYQDD